MYREAQVKQSKYDISFSNSESDTPLTNNNRGVKRSAGFNSTKSIPSPSPLLQIAGSSRTKDAAIRKSGGTQITIPSRITSGKRATPTSAQKTPLLSSISRSTPRSTPRLNTSTTSRDTPGRPNSVVIVAVVQGRGHAKCEVGIASIDLRSPNIVISQYSDTATYVRTLTKLNILNPVEMLFPNTVTESQSELYKLVSESTSCPITTVQRKYFNESLGLQYIKHLSITPVEDIQISSKYYCLSAVAALLKYIEFIQNTVFAPGSLPISFKGSDHCTMIDSTTAKLLELVSNAQDPRSPHSLFGVLNKTKTSSGAKLLRSTILQPPCDLETITLRQDCVEEILNNEELFFNLESVLGRFVDVDTTISLIIQVPKQETVKTAENRILHIIYLKHLLELVTPLGNALKDTNNSLFKALHENLQDERFGLIKDKIDEVIHENTYHQKGALSMRTQKCFAVKPHLNGLLDVARRTYSEMVDDVAETIKNLAQRYNLPLKTGFTTNRGFYIQISGKAPDLPGVFIKVVRQRSSITCTTGDLIKLNDRINESLNDIYLMTNEVTKALLQQIYCNIGCLYKLSECSAMLDMITSFAHICSLSDNIRPEFTETLALKDSIHPILSKMEHDIPVPNDVFASTAANFNILYGPNMSGKSTYIRQIALIQIMAQMGCFVPATYASVKLVNNIFSRIGSDDDIETNASTFTLEMREINYILEHITNNSLVIIDELGRGTGVEEGTALCFAICEHLLTSSNAFVFFVTHFTELLSLEKIYPNVANYHLQVNYELAPGSNTEKVEFTRKLVKGVNEHEMYGIKLAKLSSLSTSITDEAAQIAHKLREQSGYSAIYDSSEGSEDRSVFTLATHLITVLDNCVLSDEELRSYLISLKQRCIEVKEPDIEYSTGTTKDQPSTSSNLRTSTSLEKSDDV